jgi:hypothetical protein
MLLQRARRDPSAFSELYTRHVGEVHAWWGQDFTFGTVPVFKYLESRDADEVGYTLRTASLTTAPEYFFDDHDPSECRHFGSATSPVPPATRRPCPRGWRGAPAPSGRRSGR